MNRAVTGYDIPHYPRPAAIEGYGRGGFRFAGMSHRGSLLCLPSGIWAWPVSRADELNARAFERVFAEAASIGLFLLGTDVAWTLPVDLHAEFRDRKVTIELMRTGQAANTYNILLGESRPVAAGLIAVE